MHKGCTRDAEGTIALPIAGFQGGVEPEVPGEEAAKSASAGGELAGGGSSGPGWTDLCPLSRAEHRLVVGLAGHFRGRRGAVSPGYGVLEDGLASRFSLARSARSRRLISVRNRASADQPASCANWAKAKSRSAISFLLRAGLAETGVSSLALCAFFTSFAACSSAGRRFGIESKTGSTRSG